MAKNHCVERGEDVETCEPALKAGDAASRAGFRENTHEDNGERSECRTLYGPFVLAPGFRRRSGKVSGIRFASIREITKDFCVLCPDLNSRFGRHSSPGRGCKQDRKRDCRFAARSCKTLPTVLNLLQRFRLGLFINMPEIAIML
jgi:hypothetical protein